MILEWMPNPYYVDLKAKVSTEDQRMRVYLEMKGQRGCPGCEALSPSFHSGFVEGAEMAKWATPEAEVLT